MVLHTKNVAKNKKRGILMKIKFLLLTTLMTLGFSFSAFAGPNEDIIDTEIYYEDLDGTIVADALTEEEIAYVEQQKSVDELKEESDSESVTGSGEQYVNLGTFKLTAYCACKQCNGNTRGLTKSGTTCVEGRTIAVDERVIPLGSVVEINIPGEGWHRYIAEDIGGKIKGNRIDVFINGHSNCHQPQYNSVADVRLVI